ncbi:MAG: dienelactone hydrolase family protein [Sinimarinibacterium sp.]|jgi:putative phosphoribosyl transferase
MTANARVLTVAIDLPDVRLPGDLNLPPRAHGLVVFVHGSGSSRHSSRNRFVASSLVDRGFATLLFDLLTEAEDRDYETRFDIPLLTRRLLGVSAWLRGQPTLNSLPLGYFGASTGAAAALNAAAEPKSGVAAVVSRGGRPDLALDSLPQVAAPTLLIVGGADEEVIRLNQQAYAALRCPKELAIVAGATHLFEEPGTLEEVSVLAGEWFERHCAGTAAPA